MFLADFDSHPGSGLYIQGTCGSGKTSLACALARRLFDAKKRAAVPAPLYAFRVREIAPLSASTMPNSLENLGPQRSCSESRAPTTLDPDLSGRKM